MLIATYKHIIIISICMHVVGHNASNTFSFMYKSKRARDRAKVLLKFYCLEHFCQELREVEIS